MLLYLKNKRNLDTQEATIEEFKEPTLNLLSQFNSKESQTFFYVIKGGNTKLGALYCYDLPLLFGNFENWTNAPMLKNINTNSAKKASFTLQSCLAQFMKGY